MHRIFLLLALAAPLAASEEAAALLARVGEAYRDAAAYHFTATETTTTSSGDFERRTANIVVAARDAAGRTRVEFNDRVNGGVAVFDGERTWVYLPARRQFAVLSPAQVEGGVGGMRFGDLSRRFVDRYRSAAERLVESEITGEEPVSTSAGDVTATVVQAVYSPPPGMPEGRIKRTYWIASDSAAILKEVSHASMFQPQLGRRVEVVQEIDFQHAQLGGPLDERLFRFTPPKGAQQVASFDQSAAAAQLPPELDAPDFTLATLEGGEVQLSSLRGQVVLLDFWATWCGPCRFDMPHVQRLHEELGEKGLKVFGVNAEAVERAGAYLSENAYTFPTLHDPEMRVAQLYQVNAIPTFIVIDREGKLSAYLRGTRTAEQLRRAVEQAGL